MRETTPLRAGSVPPSPWPALALAVHRAKSMPEVSQDVLEGLGALAEHPDRRPHADAMEARLEAVFGDAFEFSEHLRRPVLEAAAAIYARRDPVGAAPFDARAFDAALRRVGGAVRDAAGNMKGGPFEYKGRVILPPGAGAGRGGDGRNPRRCQGGDAAGIRQRPPGGRAWARLHGRGHPRTAGSSRSMPGNTKSGSMILNGSPARNRQRRLRVVPQTRN